MGQYFKAVNLDKREYVCPWCIGGGAKFLEWCSNEHGYIWNLLLRQSTETGGGDIGAGEPIVVNLDSYNADDSEKQIQAALKYALSREGEAIKFTDDSMVGRWAGDRVTLIGDYDESDLWESLPSFHNISRQFVVEWNRHLPDDIRQLQFNEGCSCNEK